MTLFVEQFGRLGNRIQQLLHALHIAKHEGHSKIHFLFPGFSKQCLVLGNPLPGEKTRRDTCFTLDPSPTWEEYKMYAKHIRPILLSSPAPFTEIQYQKDVFIHIRSGDIFSETPHSDYVPPPLAYYQKIISEYPTGTQFHILCEDEENPVVGILKQLGYPIYTLPIKQVVTVFLNAKHIVMSVGTLVPAISLFQTPERIYCPDYYQSCLLPPTIVRIGLPEYIQPGEWKGTEHQRKQIVQYSIEDAGFNKSNTNISGITGES